MYPQALMRYTIVEKSQLYSNIGVCVCVQVRMLGWEFNHSL